VAEHCDPGRFPPGGAERVSRFTLQIRHAAQNFAGDRGDDWQNHDRYDDSPGKHTRAVDRAGEKWYPTKVLFEEWKRLIPEPWTHHEDAQKSENYARNSGQHFDQRSQRLPNPQWRKFRQIRRRCDTEWHSDD